jgi:hypothetical protein
MRIDSNIFLCYNLNCRAKAVSCLRNIFFLPSVKCLVTSEKKIICGISLMVMILPIRNSLKR